MQRELGINVHHNVVVVFDCGFPVENQEGRKDEIK